MKVKVYEPDEVRVLTWEGRTVRVYVVGGRPYASSHDIFNAVVCMGLREKCDYVEGTEYKGCILVSEDHHQVTDMGMSIKAVTYLTFVLRYVPRFDEWYRHEVADVLGGPEPDDPELEEMPRAWERWERQRQWQEYINTLPIPENHRRVDLRADRPAILWSRESEENP